MVNDHDRCASEGRGGGIKPGYIHWSPAEKRRTVVSIVFLNQASARTMEVFQMLDVDGVEYEGTQR